MLKFPSDEWAHAFKDELNKSPAYNEAAKTWEGDFVFVITPDKGKEGETYYLYCDLWHGNCRDAYLIDNLDEKSPEFTYSGTYSGFKSIIEGKVDPIKGLMQGKFKLKGNMGKIMRAVRAAQDRQPAVRRR